jgi:2-polyprenyl-3-methyl-5-hydroxy-6-metoxy-1,4-benzoquinol methylase
MNLVPHLYADLPPENVFGHRRKVECLRASIDGLRTPQRPHLRILDAGCGSGHAVTRFLPRYGDEVVGIDMHAPSINYAQSNFGGEELRFVCADLSTLPQSEGKYDVVVLADVLEHLDDPLSVLSVAVAKLAPGGLLLASIPNGRGPFEIESALSRVPVIGRALLKITDLCVALLNKTVLRGVWSRHVYETPSDLPYNGESGHVQFFSRAQFMSLLESGGLHTRRISSLSFLAGPFTNYWLAPSSSFCSWNVALANRLPYWAVSAWYFECARTQQAPSET